MTKRGTAYCMGRVNPEARAYQLLYGLEGGPLAEHGHVIVSAADVLGEAETLILSADATGRSTGESELEGSLRGTLDHNAVLEGAGYDVVKPSTSP
jgi:hypothetical protein